MTGQEARPAGSSGRALRTAKEGSVATEAVRERRPGSTLNRIRCSYSELSIVT